MTQHSKYRINPRLLALCGALSLAASGLAQTTPATNSISSELGEVITHVQSKVNAGQATEPDLAPEFKQLDELLARHKGETNDEVAQVLLTKARIYREVLRDGKKHDEVVARIQRDFPNSKPAAVLRRMELIEKVHAQLVAGAPFPEFSHKDTGGILRSPSAFKGKVLLVDFWATWCGPCVRELPNVVKVYEKHHPEGFEVIGISLDREADKLLSYVKEHNIPWPQILDERESDDALAIRYGVSAIPSTFLIDRQGRIIGVGLRGEALEQAVLNALAAK